MAKHKTAPNSAEIMCALLHADHKLKEMAIPVYKVIATPIQTGLAVIVDVTTVIITITVVGQATPATPCITVNSVELEVAHQFQYLKASLTRITEHWM